MSPDSEENLGLKDKITKELKEELKKELKAELKAELEGGLLNKDAGPTISELSDTSAVISTTYRVLLPKGLLKKLGWKKGDVIDFKVESGKLVGTKIGHAMKSIKKKSSTSKAKSLEESVAEEASASAEESVARLQVNQYFEFPLDRKISNKVRQIIENSYNLYEAGSIADAFNVLKMIDNIELKEEEPTRSKIRIAILHFISDVLPRNPQVFLKQLPDFKNIVQKMSSKFLKEKGYALLARGCKEIKAWDQLDNIIGILFTLLEEYSNNEMFAIISLLELIIDLIHDTDSQYAEKVAEYIKNKFDVIQDFDYKIRCLRYLIEIEKFKDVRMLAKKIKDETTEGSAERRNILDVLKLNREKEKAWYEKHPELKMDEEIEDEDDQK
ncbi:MAG: hypothetical protein ACTSWN_01695 [Promethearchaeota archaeon]